MKSVKALYSVSLYTERPEEEAAHIFAMLQRIAMLTYVDSPVRLESVEPGKAVYSFRLYSDDPETEAERIRIAVDGVLSLAYIAPLHLERIVEEVK